MTNPNQAFGLRPVGSLSGGSNLGKMRKVAIPASNGTALYPGDPVIITGTSLADTQGSGDILEVVALATAAGSNYISGVLVSRVVDKADDNVYLPTATAGYFLMCDDPFALFEIQGSTTDAVGDIGATASLVSGAGSTALGVSGWQLDSTTIGTGTQLTVQGVRQSDRNDLASANPVMLVTINLHQSLHTTGV